MEIASEARRHLERIYGRRLRGVYLYGSAARDQLTVDSDIDIAVILDRIASRFEEHCRTSKLGSDISLDHETVVLFFFAEENDLQAGSLRNPQDHKNRRDSSMTEETELHFQRAAECVEDLHYQVGWGLPHRD